MFSIINEKARFSVQAVSIKGEVYILGGKVQGRNVKKWPVEKYSPITKTWNKVVDSYDDRRNFSACALTDKILVFGGYFRNISNVTQSCLQFGTKNYKWKEITEMKEARRLASSVVFECRVVVNRIKLEYY